IKYSAETESRCLYSTRSFDRRANEVMSHLNRTPVACPNRSYHVSHTEALDAIPLPNSKDVTELGPDCLGRNRLLPQSLALHVNPLVLS
ncbi:hypothetical protein ACTXT7_017412, partial [Hymenolepis weldensis]